MYTLHIISSARHSRFIAWYRRKRDRSAAGGRRAWERREAFLALNPEGNTPILVAASFHGIPGAGIMDDIETRCTAWFGRTSGDRCRPSMSERIEVRRS